MKKTQQHVKADKADKAAPQSNIKSADDLIVRSEAEKLGRPFPENRPQPEIQAASEEPTTEAESESKSEELTASEQKQEETAEIEGQQEKAEQNESEADSPSLESSDSNDSADVVDSNDGNDVDEYGTKVGKKKLYTEEEVQRMIRDRLKRGQHAEQQDVVQQAAKEFSPDPDSTESWEMQLEQFVENTIQKLSQKKVDSEWREREQQSQAEFEVKFSEGMTKYKDFNSVVGGKPITNAMMLATRTMKDPAAFLYAACKQQPKELARIAQISDAVAQATEIGRLEERMKKARTIPSSPRPASRVTGDASSELPQISIDARIAAHAKTKIMR
jgi:hypothetical protein